MISLANDTIVESDLGEAASLFLKCRPRLLAIASRLLGNASDAEDVVQETWIRWQTYDRSVVRNAAAFLATTTTRLALNAVQSARVRHETPIGPWVPEPVDRSADPAAALERAEAVELAVRLVVENLSPAERAAFVLRQAFDYPYEQIAELIDQPPANTRQLVSRARRHLTERRRASARPTDHRRFLGVFRVAATTGNLTPLQRVLADDVRYGSPR